MPVETSVAVRKTDGPTRAQDPRQAAKAILDALDVAGGALRYNELLTASELAKTTFKRALDSLVKSGEVEKTEAGYCLTSCRPVAA